MSRPLLLTLSAVILLLVTATAVLSQDAGGLPEAGQSVPTERRQILVLKSYQYGQPIPDSIDTGILAVCRESGISLGDIFIEHLDLARASDSEHRANMAGMLRHKLAGKHIGVVIVEGAPAIDFVAGEAKDFFPDAALITLISPDIGPLSADPRKVLDIPWRVDPGGTLRAALDLFPGTRRVIVVTGANDGILPFLDEARKAFAPWKDKLDFEYTNEMTYEEMLQRISSLPPNTVIIYSPYFIDKSGRSFVPVEVVDKVSQAATAPVFGTLEAYLGHGIVGGSLLKTEEIGQKAGKAAVDYLNGRLKLVEPVTTFEPSTRMMFDWRELIRWKADNVGLPRDSIVINRPLTLWGQYKAEVIEVTVAFLALTLLTVVLLILNRRLKRMKVAANESEVRFRVLMERAPEAIVVYDIDLKRIVDANAKAEQLFACNREKLFRGGPDRFYRARQPDGSDVIESVKDHNLRAMTGEEVVFERALHRDDGGDLTCEVRLVRLPYHDQRLLRASFIDITQRKRSEQALRESEKRFRTLVENLPVRVFLKDRNSVYETCNPGYAKDLGIHVEEIRGRTDYDFYPHDLAEKYRSDDRKVMDSGRREEFEESYIRNGQHRWAHIIRTPLMDEEPHVTGIMGVLWDITERRSVEAERTRLIMAIEQVDEGIMIADANWIIQFANPAFARISGYSGSELIGRHARILKSDTQDQAFYTGIRSTLARGEVWSGLMSAKRKDGTLYQVQALSSPVKDASGNIINYINILRDVTLENKLERELRQAQKMESIGTLAGGIAHDFNNILGIIIGYTELAQVNVTAESSLHKNLTQVIRAGLRAKDLVNHILAFSRQTEQKKQPLQIAPVVKEGLKLLRSLLPTTIEICQEIEIASENDVVLADPTQIHQVLMNLCTNAAHAMGASGGVLGVRLSAVDASAASGHSDLRAGPYLMLTVTDTGHGMDAAVMERIFDPYFTTKGVGEGTGLGLSVVQGIVKDHGGAITAYSEPGRGTTFHVCLPTVEENVAPKVVTHEAPPLGNERILFVDDEKSIVGFGKDMLEALGYKVTARTSSLEALETFRAESGAFDLVITDMTMPDLTGAALAQRLRAIRKDIPIILCSGFSPLMDGGQAKKLGISEYITKPYKLTTLAKAVRKALEQK